MKTITAISLLLISLCFSAQNAPIKVSVTDFKNSPISGEQIQFINSVNKKTYSGISSADGRFNISLPGGFIYQIKIKSIGKARDYSSFDIPAIGQNQMYIENTVQIMIEQPKSFTLENVLFDTGKSSLKPSSHKELDELVGLLKHKPKMKIEIAGHTDNIGNAASNLQLSTDRAHSVHLYLIKNGINKNRLTAKGYGDLQPIASNENEESRKLNRRTEIRVLEN